jgi:hypothetical protein
MTAAIISPKPVLAEIARIEAAFPTEFRDGARYGLLGNAEGQREKGGNPLGRIVN